MYYSSGVEPFKSYLRALLQVGKPGAVVTVVEHGRTNPYYMDLLYPGRRRRRQAAAGVMLDNDGDGVGAEDSGLEDGTEDADNPVGGIADDGGMRVQAEPEVSGCL